MIRFNNHFLAVSMIIALTILALSGCAKPQVQTPAAVGDEKDSLQIVTSFYPIYVLTKNITAGIDDVAVTNMTEAQTGCLHDYQLSPDDLKLLETSDAFIINGAGMEAFLDKIIAQNPDMTVVEAAKGIPLIKDPSGEDNPHVWVGITGAIEEVRNISQQLSEIDPAHGAQYQANSDAYIKRLTVLRDKMHQELDGFAGKEIITFHEAFPYFAKEFNLKIATVIEREPGSEPTAKELAETIKIIRDRQIKALFAEPQYPSKAAETISQETGLKVYYLDPAASGSGDAPADSYEKTMEANLEILKEALQ